MVFSALCFSPHVNFADLASENISFVHFSSKLIFSLSISIVLVVNDVVNVMAAYQPVVQACGTRYTVYSTLARHLLLSEF